MRRTLPALIGVAAICVTAQAAAELTLYQNEGFRGPVFSTDRPVRNFDRTGFNDRASSAVVEGGSWEACEDEQFSGRCVVLRPGSYASLSGMGMNDRISSVRPVDGRASYPNYAPAPVAAAPAYEYRQRPNERLYEAPVTYVRAVVGPPEQRCWVEREQVQDRGSANVPGA